MEINWPVTPRACTEHAQTKLEWMNVSVQSIDSKVSELHARDPWFCTLQTIRTCVSSVTHFSQRFRHVIK